MVKGRHSFQWYNTVSTPPGSKIMRITINEHIKIIEQFCCIHLTLFLGGGGGLQHKKRNYYLNITKDSTDCHRKKHIIGENFSITPHKV